MKIIIVQSILIITLVSCARTDDFETCSGIALGCIHSKNSALIQDLELVENFLIAKNYISDTTKVAYLDFIGKLEAGDIDVNPNSLNEYIFNADTSNLERLSQSKVSIFQECIFESQGNTNNSPYYEWVDKILLKTINDEFRTRKSNAISVGVKKETFEYSDIPDELFNNDLIHYCFLMSLYQRLQVN